MKLLLAGVAALFVAACATAAPPGEEPARRAIPGNCDAATAQSFVGQRATAETGEAILRATGASALRWLLPNAVVTLEYSAGRVNVGYAVRTITGGQELYVTRVSCG